MTRATEKSSANDIITKRTSKLTASVCERRRAVGSRRSRRENLGRTSVMNDSPISLWRKRTKSPVMGTRLSALRVSGGQLRSSMRRNAKCDFFLRAMISPSASLQTSR